jgi:hypothetical protein
MACFKPQRYAQGVTETEKNASVTILGLHSYIRTSELVFTESEGEIMNGVRFYVDLQNLSPTQISVDGGGLFLLNVCIYIPD